MKTRLQRLSYIPTLVLLAAFALVRPVSAHPADVYTHSIHISIAQSGLSIKWEIKPGPMLISYIWFNADTNQDNTVSADEANAWARTRVPQLTATLDGKTLPLNFDGIEFPSSQDAFQSGQEFITLHLSSPWPAGVRSSFTLAFHNGFEEQKSLNWYFLDAADELKFQTPQQRNSSVSLQIFQPSAQTSSKLITTWDSSMPSLSSWQGGQPAATPEPNAPTFQQNAQQQMLLDLVRNQDLSIPFFAFALAVSLVLGALHALTPGHGKTVVAAYLVGSRGTPGHAVLLGTVVTLTHTGSVFALGLVTLAASKYILPTSIIPVLEIVSGLLIVGFGLYLFWQRYVHWRAARGIIPAAPRKFSLTPAANNAGKPSGGVTIEKPAEGMHDHGDGKMHSHTVPDEITLRSLVSLGVSGGLVPCPDAIAILLVAVAINRILLGLALIVSFSLGLALVLIVIGLLMVSSRRLFDRFNAFSRLMPIMPMVSAVVVTALGAALTYGAVARAQSAFDSGATSPGGVGEAQILYLADDANKVAQLYEAGLQTKSPRVITHAENGVVDYSLSPDQSRVVYVLQTKDLVNEIWIADLASGDNKKLSDCTSAICSSPVWSPNGAQLVYEYMDLSGSNATGLATLWTLDVNSGTAKPLFAETQLPGVNPRWSPDGKWLSFANTDSVRLYNIATGESRSIKSTLGAAANWSPDGKSVLYRDVIIQNGQFVTQLFLYDLSTAATRSVSPDLGFENLLAAWSPDGKSIAIVRRDLSVTRGDQIWVMRADGSNLHQLTNQSAVLHGSLIWSADGTQLLYDLYPLDSYPLQSSLQSIDVSSGKITDLGILGYNPQWVGK